MKKIFSYRMLALLLAMCLMLGLCACSRVEDYLDQEETAAPALTGPAPESAAEASEKPFAEPMAAPVEEPAAEPTAVPVDVPTEAPVEATAAEPAAETAEEPTEEPTEEPVDVPADVPTEALTAGPEEETAEEPTVEILEEPIAETMGEALADPEIRKGTGEENEDEREEESVEEDIGKETGEETAEEEIPDLDEISYLTLTDEDGDGIIQYRFYFKGASVYALIVLDPSRVFVGTAITEPVTWGQGITLDQMAEKYGAVAGINAGGFVDEDGGGMGWPPRGITFGRGIVFNGEQYGPVAAIDYEDNMWAGYFDFNDCMLIGIRDAVCFGPVLVREGEKADPSQLEEGIGARTLIGQRADGAIVMVAIDGRQGYSIGVTFPDCVDIMADKFGCVNAANMDGGNSTCMYYDGQAVNRSSNQAGGTRYLPDAWLVRPLPEDYVRPEGVPDSIDIPENILGAQRTYVGECDEETKERMYTFAWVFTKAYYGYWGTPNHEKHYSDMLQYVAQDCELRDLARLGLMDRKWVNTWGTEPTSVTLDGAYINPDGSYDMLLTLDVVERSTYWTYEAKGIQLRVTVVDAPTLPYGFLATNTY